ncbi:cysteate racemase [Chryseobacterium paridis]|uniref:Aspartate/glutamate racemase family protein n=1 Tax=Chryseobacterium paridis TaxID=2800328 RepID=A0ABS1FWG0_9FLAO|nr:amino acid racemase [Chryseobacterium paridis]MBK1896554.1 aspartate/glutamate racemase family protein [Chryseobacterium paridis]
MGTKEKLAIIGGLGTLSGGDLFFKLLKSRKVLKNQLNYHFIFEQQPYNQMDVPLHHKEDIKSRKFYTYNICKRFEEQNVTRILLPCFASHSFLHELQTEISIPILSLYDAILKYLKDHYKKGSKIGILTSNFIKESEILQTYFSDYKLIFPEKQGQLMDAIYNEKGIKNGILDGFPLEHIYEICCELEEHCDIILPCITEISLITDSLRKRGVRIIDINQIYADYALSNNDKKHIKPFKLGILGGVGPSATVDFMNKVIKNTSAKRDQDHIKMIVEQNPQIPDRTAHLIYNDTDPTIAMFSTCKQLEAEGANAIAIPCNTAHAFVHSIQSHLTIPIINMLDITAEYIIKTFGNAINIGLLATTGTIESKVYHEVFARYGLTVVIPDELHQEYVMESIYGKEGVKAGYTEGACKNNILKAARYLMNSNAHVIILGCTELPLMFQDQEFLINDNKEVPLVDPTLILAKECVRIAE